MENLLAKSSSLVIAGFLVFGFSFIADYINTENVTVDINDVISSGNVRTNLNESMKYLFGQANLLLSKRPSSVMDTMQLLASGNRYDFLENILLSGPKISKEIAICL